MDRVCSSGGSGLFGALDLCIGYLLLRGDVAVAGGLLEAQEGPFEISSLFWLCTGFSVAGGGSCSFFRRCFDQPALLEETD